MHSNEAATMKQNIEDKIQCGALTILAHLQDCELEKALPVALELTRALVNEIDPKRDIGTFAVALAAKVLLTELSSTLDSLFDEIDELHDHIEELEIQLSRIRRQKQSGERNGN